MFQTQFIMTTNKNTAPYTIAILAGDVVPSRVKEGDMIFREPALLWPFATASFCR
jgi:hypothetical protein